MRLSDPVNRKTTINNKEKSNIISRRWMSSQTAKHGFKEMSDKIGLAC